MSMETFNEAYNHTMVIEGGYANDPDDLGGETYKGIARNYHPLWEGWAIIDAMKQRFAMHTTAGVRHFDAEARRDEKLQYAVLTFYKAKFWDPWMGDRIAARSKSIALEMFDTGVNMGTGRAVEFLQEALNCLDRNTQRSLVVDGAMGPNTMGRFLQYVSREEALIFKMLNVLQGAYYMKRMKQSPTQEKYARGWFKRVTIERQVSS